MVKASFFPAWEARGAEGPFRVAPNFMVVVPTETDVELVFVRTTTDLVAIVLTGIGLLSVGVLGVTLRGGASRRKEDVDILAPGPTEAEADLLAEREPELMTV